jgi:hypothetical protein
LAVAFLGTTLATAALAVMAVFRWSEPGAMAMLAGAVLYVVGMFVVTMAFNVPLNDALAAVDPSSSNAASLVGALSERLDVVESHTDDLVHRGLRALHRRRRGEIGRPACRRQRWCLLW